MEYKQAKSLIARLSHQIRFLGFSFLGLLFCNALLAILLWHQSGRERLVLVPSNLQQTATITHQSVSRSYLEAMALMLLNDRLNMTPETIIGNNQHLLQFVDPGYYAVFKKQLTQDAATIQHGKISSTFYVSQVQASPIKLQVNVDGHLKRWVGERFIGDSHKHYQLHFSRRGPGILLTAFHEHTPHSGKSS